MSSIQEREVPTPLSAGFEKSERTACARPSSGQLDPVRLRRVQAHIAKNLDRNLSLVELANIACLIPYHFIRCFRRATGCPPHRYLRVLRLEYAKMLLSEPGSSIANISLECGLSSQASFTRAFRTKVGISPASYRKLRSLATEGSKLLSNNIL